MCGIAGRFDSNKLSPNPEWSEHADQLLSHRGPDGSGCFKDEYCELIHRRLAIMDLSDMGRQPMSNENGNIQVVLNGEIYNFLRLRNTLIQRGHTFRGESDTEVLPHLYEEYGLEMIKMLRGMFVFALYDARSRRLLIARDRFGIKPLFFTIQKNELLFASEMKAILANRDLNFSLDRQACFDYLGLGYIPEPKTGFNEIQVLLKGSYLFFDNGQVLLEKYHEINALPDFERNLKYTTDELEKSLLSAVASQRIADVPVAILLSGGIDSSLVTAAYCRQAIEPPETFNVRFPDQEYDETAMALEVSKHYGTHHHVIDIRDWEINADQISELFVHFDQPFADTSLIPTYLVAKVIRENGFKCALSGDGGDEAFGGYKQFMQIETLVRLMRVPDSIKRLLAVFGDKFSLFTQDFGRQLARAVSLAQAGQMDSSRLLAGFANYLSENQKEELMIPFARESLLSADRLFIHNHPSSSYTLDEVSRRMTEDLFAMALPNDMLKKIDMMSMLVGLEVRVPMLDEEIVSLRLSLSHRLKTDGVKGKIVLRSLAKKWLPTNVARHPKHGFTIPLDRLLTNDTRIMLNDLLLTDRTKTGQFFKAEVIRDWVFKLQNAQNGYRGGDLSREGLYQRVFMALGLELWMRKYNLSW